MPTNLTFLQGSWSWMIQICVVFFCALCINFFQKKIITRFLSKLRKTGGLWNRSLLEALQPPLTLFIWIAAIACMAEIVEKETEAAIFDVIGILQKVGIIATIAWFLIKVTAKAKENILESRQKSGKDLDRTTADAVAKIVHSSIIIVSALFVLQSLGFSISGILAFGGIGGIAVGFAAKDLLSNFFGGFMLYWDRPFKIGDWIRSPDRNIEGVVESIGWRLTCIRTFDKRPLYVPNSLFATISVENPSRMLNRRIQETIGVRYEDAEVIRPILEDVRKMLQTHPEIDQSQILMVNLNTYGASSLDFFIYTFTRTIEWVRFHKVKEDVLLKIYDIITSRGAEVAFSTSTVRLCEQFNKKREQAEKLSQKIQELEKRIQDNLKQETSAQSKEGINN